MRPSEISLFTTKEQELLIATELARLDDLGEDELVDLLGRVRRGRNKYSDLHRRQGASAVKKAGTRHAAATSNERTSRKAEIFEDAVSRVARFVSRVARANANEIKRQRLAAARKSPSSPTAPKRSSSASNQPAGTRSGKSSRATVSGQRVGATSAANKRKQGARDSGRKGAN